MVISTLVLMTILSFEPTYEELKHIMEYYPTFSFSCFEPTYEELKREIQEKIERLTEQF